MLVRYPSFLASLEKLATRCSCSTVKVLSGETMASLPSRSQSMPSKPFSKPGPAAALFHFLNLSYHSAPE